MKPEQHRKLSDLEWEHVLIGYHVREKSSFVSELFTRISHRLLPPYVEEEDARILVDLDRKRFDEVLSEAYATEPELQERIAKDGRHAFDQLGAIANGELENRPIYDRIRQLGLTPVFIPRADGALSDLTAALSEMLSLLSAVRQSYGRYGTSIELSYRTEKLVSDVTLLRKLLDLFTTTDVEVQRETLAEIIDETFRDQSIVRFVERKLLSVLVEIVSHNADTGEQYIADSKDELKNYFISACIGGVLVSLFALCKIGIASLELPPLSEAFMFGLNYALCFVFATLAGGTIATKQPAMTGHAFSRALSSGSGQAAWVLFKRLLSSQTVTLSGNVISVALVTLLIWYAVLLPNDVFVDPAYHISKNSAGMSTFWYAAIAGVWLSFSGLLSGYFSNLLVFHRIAERVQIRGLSFPKMQKIAPKLFGSVVLGFLLGGTGSIGVLTGIPIDIRHVAFSSAQVTLGIIADTKIAALAIAGVALIGLVNLVVSFLITWWVSRLQLRASRSRIPIEPPL